MQIVLVQSEIEAAIRESLVQNIVLRDDQALNIDFVVSRGEEGIKANITLVKTESTIAPVPSVVPAPVTRTAKSEPKKEEKTVAQQTQEAKPEEVLPAIRSTPENRKEPEPLQAKPEPKPAPAVKQEAQVAPVAAPQTIFSSPKTSAPTPAPATPGPGATGEAKPAAKSLFAGLARPVNPKPEQPAS